MKRYKLKQWYPGCGKLEIGSIISNKRDNLVYFPEGFFYLLYFGKSSIENNPLYWELINSEIKQEKIKSYEIICVKHKENKFFYTKVIDLRTLHLYDIQSIKRLSDGEIFTVGDDIKGHIANGKIEKFKTNNNLDIIIFFDYYTQGLSNISHIKKSLFKTEDGVDIYKDDKCCWINKGIVTSMFKWKGDLNNVKYFSTKKAAFKYIEDNKPKLLFTTEDSFKIYSNSNDLTLYGVAPQSNGADCIIAKTYQVSYETQLPKNRLWFYDTGKAEEYLLYNKPVLSLMDIAKVYITANPNYGKRSTSTDTQYKKLIKIIKEKIYNDKN